MCLGVHVRGGGMCGGMWGGVCTRVHVCWGVCTRVCVAGVCTSCACLPACPRGTACAQGLCMPACQGTCVCSTCVPPSMCHADSGTRGQPRPAPPWPLLGLTPTLGGSPPTHTPSVPDVPFLCVPHVSPAPLTPRSLCPPCPQCPPGPQCPVPSPVATGSPAHSGLILPMVMAPAVPRVLEGTQGLGGGQGGMPAVSLAPPLPTLPPRRGQAFAVSAPG